MRRIDIVKGFNTFGYEDVFPTDPTVTLKDGDIINMDGTKTTLTDTHIECGIAIQPTNLGSSEFREASKKTPVYISNFKVRTKAYTAATYHVGDPVTVIDGLPAPVNGTNTIVWGYVTAVNAGEASIDIRVNY